MGIGLKLEDAYAFTWTDADLDKLHMLCAVVVFYKRVDGEYEPQLRIVASVHGNTVYLLEGSRHRFSSVPLSRCDPSSVVDRSAVRELEAFRGA